MIIKPYADIAAEAFDPADYPACKFFADFSTASVVDLVSGDTLVPASGTFTYTPSEDGASGPLTSTAVLIIPTIVQTAGKFLLAVESATPSVGFTANRVSFENATAANGKLDINATAGAASYDDANGTPVTGSAAMSFSPALTRELLAAGVTAGAAAADQLKGYQLLDTGSGLAYTTDNTTPARAMYPAGFEVSFDRLRLFLSDTGTDAALHGVWLFEFDAVPSDIKAALAWMTTFNTVYPGWKGRS